MESCTGKVDGGKGTILLGARTLPLVVIGSRSAPDAGALALPNRSPQASVARARRGGELFEHHSPYAEAVAAGDVEAPVGSPGTELEFAL